MGGFSRKFEPWKRDRQLGLKLAALGLGLGVGAAAFALNGSLGVALGFGAAALALAGAGISRLKRAANREFGKVFEQAWTERALTALSAHGIHAQANIMARGIGDIDLVVHVEGGRIPVEIKSFRKWNQFFFFKGEREGRALKQSDKQRQALDAVHSVVWVPQGRPTLLQRLFGAGSGNVVVIFGSERALLKGIRRLAGA